MWMSELLALVVPRGWSAENRLYTKCDTLNVCYSPHFCTEINNRSLLTWAGPAASVKPPLIMRLPASGARPPCLSGIRRQRYGVGITRLRPKASRNHETRQPRSKFTHGRPPKFPAAGVERDAPNGKRREHPNILSAPSLRSLRCGAGQTGILPGRGINCCLPGGRRQQCRSRGPRLA